MTSAEAKARKRMAVGATVALAGIAVSVGAESSLGAWLTVAGVVLLIYSLHEFGRTGPG